MWHSIWIVLPVKLIGLFLGLVWGVRWPWLMWLAPNAGKQHVVARFWNREVYCGKRGMPWVKLPPWREQAVYRPWTGQCVDVDATLALTRANAKPPSEANFQRGLSVSRPWPGLFCLPSCSGQPEQDFLQGLQGTCRDVPSGREPRYRR